MLEFKFTVSEYLKGSGGNRISGLVAVGMRYRSEAEVQSRRRPRCLTPTTDDGTGVRAVVFLTSSHYWAPEYFQPAAGQYWFGPMFRHTADAGLNDAYTVASIHSSCCGCPKRPPAARRARARLDKTFLLDLPTALRAGRSTSQSRSYTPDPPPASEITLSSLRSKTPPPLRPRRTPAGRTLTTGASEPSTDTITPGVTPC